MRIKRKTFNLWKRRFFIFLGIFCISSIFFVYFKTSFLTITSYELVGVPDNYQQTIQTNLRSIAAEKSYKIFPSNRITSYRGMVIKSSIVSVLPNSQTVTLRIVGLHTLRITVTTYIPLFKIDGTHAITKEGFIYNELNDIQILPKISFATSTMRQEMYKDGISYAIIPTFNHSQLDSLVRLINKINTVVFVVSNIIIDEYGDILLQNKEGGSGIIFSGASNVDTVWSNILSAIDTEPLKSKLETKKETLEYLDARFGNKVFYKFTNDSKTVIIESHATTTATTTLPR